MKEFEMVTYGNQHLATHAICKCGVIAEIKEDNHTCIWTWLKEIERKGGKINAVEKGLS